MKDPLSATTDGDPASSQGLHDSVTDVAGNTSISELDHTPKEEGYDANNVKSSLDGEGAFQKEAGAGQSNLPPGEPTILDSREVSEVLASEIGVSTLLNRLKQSVASTKEFATFLKKRSQLEEDHASSLKKLCRSSLDSSHRAEHRQGTFALAYDEMMHIHERMAENGSQFATSLYQMHDDLVELASSAERNRKTWKQNGLAAEQKVADLEATMRKSKVKYDSLADDYDKVRTGDSRPGGKVFGLKGPKSAAQHEEDLLRKVQGADQTYHGHVQTLQSEKAHLENSSRPDMVRTLQDIIRETDSGLALQMQKFASFNEKLILSNGLIVSPMQNPDQTSPNSRSMRTTVASIHNEKDLGDFISSQHANVAPKTEVKYERNAVLNPPSGSMNQYQPPTDPMQSFNPPGSQGNQGSPGGFPPPASQQSFSMASRTGTESFGQNSPTTQGPPQNQFRGPAGGPPGPTPLGQQQNERNLNQGNMMQPPQQHQTQPPPSSYQWQGAPQLAPMSFGNQSPQSGAPDPKQTNWPNAGGPQSVPGYSQANRNGPAVGPAAPVKPVFGVSLATLYDRDSHPVPMVVQQCVQAVNLFGLNVEGIYRQSGSKVHIDKLRGMFNSNSESPDLDFRNPENFYHDVNSVSGLLKQFLRELPDPVLTREHHDGLIQAAKNDDPIVRRDKLHAIINALPDPHYATLRAITLHLYRVMDNSHVNRMNSHNLAVIFGPTLMGSDTGTAIADAGWQIKAVDTILQNTYQIFDED